MSLNIMGVCLYARIHVQMGDYHVPNLGRAALASRLVAVDLAILLSVKGTVICLRLVRWV